MKIIACIPARYAATRFPYKLMQPLGNKTVLQHTYNNTLATNLFDDVLVITDHDIIFQSIEKHGGNVMMSKTQHDSGTDRIAEAIQQLEADVVINVQGDEPFVQKAMLADMVNEFRTRENLQVASLMKKIVEAHKIPDPNVVKVVCDAENFALYFSRSAIPFNRGAEIDAEYFEHVGIYGYSREVLLSFTKWSASPLEKMEKLEQLRLLHYGVKIKMLETNVEMVKIDVPADLKIAEDFLKSQTKNT